jgi:3-oxoacyl-[acyl-carrier protein] reductase
MASLGCGSVDTELNPTSRVFAWTLRSLMALWGFGVVNKIAGFAAYLASPEVGYFTGANLITDGGFAASLPWVTL